MINSMILIEIFKDILDRKVLFEELFHVYLFLPSFNAEL